jgi:hypothetical protein
MKKFVCFIGFFLVLSPFCWAGGSKEKQDNKAQGQTQTQQQIPTPKPVETPPPQSIPLYWTGDGGKGKSLGILVPKSQGLNKDLEYVPSMVQGILVANMSKYSAMSVLDRVAFDKIIAETLDPVWEDSEAIVRLGHVAHVGLMMTGNIIKTSIGYTLQINVSDTVEAKTIAAYSGVCTVAQLDDQTAIQIASKELLTQMGVSLSAKAIEELGTTVTLQTINAQAALAQGIVAEKQGTIVQALSYFIQSSGYDPSLAEAASRMNILNANISSGNIGADTRNEIAWRRQWVTRLQEAETFFTNYVRNPQYYLVYSTDIQKGKINWQNETISLSFELKLDPEPSWMDPINGVINAIKSGFLSTGKVNTWEIDWPAKSAFGGVSPFASKTMNYTVVAEILNDKGTSIGRQTVTTPYGYEIKDGIITALKYWQEMVSFPGVKADAITDTLTIRIASIDGITAENASRQKNISVMPRASTAYQKILADRAAVERATHEAKYGILKVGDRGPAGGIVFYDKGYFDDWRYLEAAPADLQNAAWGLWGLSGEDIIDTVTGIGAGKWNTDLIIAALNQRKEIGKASQICKSFNRGVYNDWFLPSKDELDLMYKNLKQRGLGGFSNNWYWSSSRGSSVALGLRDSVMVIRTSSTPEMIRSRFVLFGLFSPLTVWLPLPSQTQSGQSKCTVTSFPRSYA